MTRGFGARPLLVLSALLLIPALPWAQVVGWRTDGTGRYPQANLVTSWSPETNVIWAAEMPGASNATPVIVGDRLFVTSEPFTLMCLNLSDGAALWQANHDYTDIAPPEQLADMAQKQAEYDDLLRQIAINGRDRGLVRKQLQDNPDNEDLKTRMRELNEAFKQLQARLAPYLDIWYVRPQTHPYNGYASATPVSDGQHVWAIFGNGIACCYDLQGNRIWARPLQKPTNSYGHSASPVLADGKLIMHVLTMQALDPLTGELIWEAKIPPYWGTPIVVQIQGTPVIITPNGFAVNATNGAILAQGLGNCNYAAPVVHEGVVYFADDTQDWRAVRLPDTLDPFTVQEVWHARPKKDRYYSSPVVHDGIIYGVTRSQFLSALDINTGQVLYEQNLALGKGECYSSITLAGDKLLLVCDNGNAVVFAPGPSYQELARSMLDTCRSCPVFQGDRMYLRTYSRMYCIGAP